MAVIDSTAEFANAVSIAAAAGTINVGNVMDLTLARNIGRGQPIYCFVSVDTSIVAAGAGTLQFRLVEDTAAPPSTSAPASILALSPVFATAASTPAIQVAGKTLWVFAIPEEVGQGSARYLGLQAIIGAQTISAGKVDSALTIDPSSPYFASAAAVY